MNPTTLTLLIAALILAGCGRADDTAWFKELQAQRAAECRRLGLPPRIAFTNRSTTPIVVGCGYGADQ